MEIPTSILAADKHHNLEGFDGFMKVSAKYSPIQLFCVSGRTAEFHYRWHGLIAKCTDDVEFMFV